MPKFNRVLCAVDLSKNSYGAIDLATTLAKQLDATVVFCFVTPVWEPSKSSGLQEHAKQIIEDDKTQLFMIRPTDPTVSFEHEFIHGNAGPEIVKATKSADLVVMSTHGRSGIARFIMGSVANYVLRNAKCPVYLVKGVDVAQENRAESNHSANDVFVTNIMHNVSPVRAYETMDSVLASLQKARETAAPVIDSLDKCIGILTSTDIERFHSLQKRFEEKDETVVDEMFEVDKYGQRRCGNYNFDQVERHMTKDVISVRDSSTVQDAIELFKANPQIHHLVVLDEDSHAVGIVDSKAATNFHTVAQEASA